MKGLEKKYVLLFLLMAFLLSLVIAQEQQYKFQHLTTEDGLPSNYTWSVFQDSRGFMWFTTRAGLCRYDGYNIKVFQNEDDDTTSISNIYVKSTIAEDTNGFIWVGSMDGLNKYDPVTEQFQRYYYQNDDSGSINSKYMRCIYVDREGTVWIGTQGGGLNCYDQKTDRFTNFLPSPDHLYSNTIRGIYEDDAGNLWIGTGNGLYQFNKDTKKFTMLYKLGNNSVKINARFITFVEDQAGKLWVCADKIYTYDKVSGEISSFESVNKHLHQMPNPKYMSIFLDTIRGNATLWIANESLFKYDIKSDLLFNVHNDPEHPDRYIGANPRAFCRDASGVMWVATTSGITKFDPGLHQITLHTDFYNTYQFNAQSFLKDSKDHFWIGGSGGVVHFDVKMSMIRWYKSSPDIQGIESLNGRTVQIFEDNNHNIWLVNQKTGIYFLDKIKDEFLQCKLMKSRKEVKPGNFYTIYEDTKRTVWVCSDGLFKGQAETTTPPTFYLDTSNAITANYTISMITEDRSGNLWISSNVGGLLRQPLSQRGTDNFKWYVNKPGNPNSLSNSHVWCVYADDYGVVWSGTNNGLNKYNEIQDNFERYLVSTEGGTSFIYDIVRDSNKYLWMTTENGLISFDPISINSPDDQEGRIKQHLTFDQAYNGKMYQDSYGIIYVGSTRSSNEGYYSINPGLITENTHIPPLFITGFSVRNGPKELDSNIRVKKHLKLKYDENFFSFEFAALDYTNPLQNQYAYMLEGLDEDWIYSGNRRFASYTKVPPGEYVFRAKGSNSDGYWNEEGTSISITINPPPWLTWWAYSLYAMLVIGLIYAWRRYDLKRQRLKQQFELEQVEAKKLKELDTLKSRFFANISHEFRTPLTLILGPVEKHLPMIKESALKQDLSVVQRNALRLQRLINQILNLSKIESGKMKLQAREVNVVSLVNGYVQSFESLAKQKNIELLFKAQKENIHLYMDKDKMEKILCNLLSNAFKFTDEGGAVNVEVGSWQTEDENLQLSLKDETITDSWSEHSKEKMDKLKTADSDSQWMKIIISDTGRGIPPEKLPHIFDRFYQADDSYTRNHEGTGIGLAMTNELVKLHHGRITVESRLEKGTTFTVTLPMGTTHYKRDEIVVDEPIGNQHLSKSDHTVEFPVHQKKQQNGTAEQEEPKSIVLIVEDNKDLLSYIREYLEKSYFILEAMDGEDGFQKALEHTPDLILSDVMMPKMDGFILCENLKSDKRTSHIPVILLTARASTENKIEGLETGADDYISKPFDQKELLVRITNLIQQRKRLREKFSSNFWKEDQVSLLKSVTSGLNQMDRKFLQKALDVVILHLSDSDFDVRQLEQEMAMSRQQMHRKFKALLDQSATEFIKTIRLKKAAELLLIKSGTISEIAFDVGFNTLSYFSKCFQKQFGVVPSEYLDKNSINHKS